MTFSSVHKRALLSLISLLAASCTTLNDPTCPGTFVDCRPAETWGGAGPVRETTNHPVPRARQQVHPGDHVGEVFVGLSLSGGGSRAANFGLAALRELDEIGLLQHVNVIASTSGGGLAGAYYALNGPEIHSERTKEVFRENFLGRWLLKQLYPHNIVRQLLTSYNRADLMAEVFDEQLFKGATYAKLGSVGTGRPGWLATSTDFASSQRRFVFSEEQFGDIGSRLDTYPISRAVMASGAFPGIFNSITLRWYPLIPRDFSDIPGIAAREKAHRIYRHVFDGGATDNLGVDTLIEFAATHRAAAGANYGGCFLFIVDAYAPTQQWKAIFNRDARGVTGRAIDFNFLEAVNVLLAHRRDDILGRAGLGLDRANRGSESFFVVDTPGFGSDLIHPYKHVASGDLADPKLSRWRDVPPGGNPQCMVWHITLSELRAISAYVPDGHGSGHFLTDSERSRHPISWFREQLWRLVVQIDTNYRLVGPRNCSPEVLQNALFAAARVAIREDYASKKAACEWFVARRLPVGPGCSETVPPQEHLSPPIKAPGYPNPYDRRVECIVGAG